ncbi:MAG: DUF2341 domain-containing protein [archaeon]
MMASTGRKRMFLVGLFILLTLATIFVIQKPSATGHVTFETPQYNGTSGNITQEEFVDTFEDINITVPVNLHNDTIASGAPDPANPGGRGKKSSDKGQTSLAIHGLGNGISLWKAGKRIDSLIPGDSARYTLFSEESVVAEFEIDTTAAIDLSDLVAVSDITSGKGLFHTNNPHVKNKDLFVPRTEGDDSVRICENAANLAQIYKGCGNEEGITEYVLKPGDDRLSLAKEGRFFKVSGIKGTGGASETYWQNESYGKRLMINVTENSGNDLGEYQIKIFFDTGRMISEGTLKPDCSDILFVNGTNQEVAYYIDENPGYACGTNNTLIWVKVPILKGGLTDRLYMYHGYSLATSKSSMTDVFSYSVPRQIYYTVGENLYDGNVSFVAYRNNTNVTTLSGSVMIGEGEIGSFTQAQHGGTGASYFNVTGPILGGDSSSSIGAELVPISFASKEFVWGNNRGDIDLYFVSPFADITVSCYEAMINATTWGAVQDTAACLEHGACSATAKRWTSGRSIKCNSTAPFLGFVQIGDNANYPLYPVSSDVYGLSNARFSVGEDSKISELGSGGSNITDSRVLGYQVNPNDGSDGTGYAWHIISDSATIGGMENDDGDGTENAVFRPEYELEKEYFFYKTGDYVSMAVTGPNATCTLSAKGGYPELNATSNGTYGYPFPSKACVGCGQDSQTFGAGSRIMCSDTFGGYWETIDDDESTLYGMKSGRQYVWPEPIFSIGQDESQPSANASIRIVDITPIIEEASFLIQANCTNYWENILYDASIVLEDNSSGYYNITPLSGQMTYTNVSSYYIGNLVSTNSSATYTYNVTGIIPGNYSYRVYCNASNSGGLGYSSKVYMKVLDTVAPQIYDPRNESTSDTITIIAWETDELSNSTVNYGVALALGTKAYDSGATLSHSVVLNDLLAGTLYYFNVSSCDASENCNSSGTYNFTTGSIADSQAPIIIWSIINISETGAAVNINASENSNLSFRYGVALLDKNYSGASYLSSRTFILSQLIPFTTYYYNITMCDISGNCNKTGISSFKTLDISAPIIVNVSYPVNDSRIKADTIDFNFTAIDNVAVANCTLYTNSSGVFAPYASSYNLTNNTNSNITISLASGRYLWNILCSDPAGNLAWNFNRTFTQDNNAPFISGISDAAEDTSVIINWTTDEISNAALEYGQTMGLGEYSYMQSFSTYHEARINSLDVFTLYYYRISYCDDLGSCNMTGIRNFTTTDETLPVVTLIYPANKTYIDADSIDINFTATDNIEIENCTLYTNYSGSFVPYSTLYSVANNTATNFVMTLADGHYTVNWNILCMDSSANSAWCQNNNTFTRDNRTLSATLLSKNIVRPGSIEITGEAVYNTGEYPYASLEIAVDGARADIVSGFNDTWWNSSWRKRVEIDFTSPVDLNSTFEYIVLDMDLSTEDPQSEIRIVDMNGTEINSTVLHQNSSSGLYGVAFSADLSRNNTNVYYAYYANSNPPEKTKIYGEYLVKIYARVFDGDPVANQFSYYKSSGAWSTPVSWDGSNNAESDEYYQNINIFDLLHNDTYDYMFQMANSFSAGTNDSVFTCEMDNAYTSNTIMHPAELCTNTTINEEMRLYSLAKLEYVGDDYAINPYLILPQWYAVTHTLADASYAHGKLAANLSEFQNPWKDSGSMFGENNDTFLIEIANIGVYQLGEPEYLMATDSVGIYNYTISVSQGGIIELSVNMSANSVVALHLNKTIIVDDTLPNISIISPANGSVTTASAFNLTWDVVEDISQNISCAITLDDLLYGPKVSMNGTNAFELNLSAGVGKYNLSCETEAGYVVYTGINSITASLSDPVVSDIRYAASINRIGSGVTINANFTFDGTSSQSGHFLWYVGGINVYNETVASVPNNTVANSTLSSVFLDVGSIVNVSIYSSTDTHISNASWSDAITIYPQAPTYSSFTGDTTDFNTIPWVDNIDNIVFDVPPHGKIEYNSQSMNASGLEFDSAIHISQNNITVESVLLNNDFNSSANLTLYGLSYLFLPTVIKDGLVCSSCTAISYNVGAFKFMVSGFSSYTASANSRLEIWDETDEGMPYAGYTKFAGDSIIFYANYTNISSGESIVSNCNITVNSTTYDMTYNVSKRIYEYGKAFPDVGMVPFMINCDGNTIGFEALGSDDAATISTNNGPVGVNITQIKTERGQESYSVNNIGIEGGNVTTLGINMTILTRSWQGLYGNITGEIKLEDPAGNRMYDWNILSPAGEVYASRTSNINFGSIGCIDTSGILAEEAYLGQTATDSDSVNTTFSKQNHPEFSVGQVSIPADSCRSTNLYVNGASQDDFFHELLLTDDASNLIYVTLVENHMAGFDNLPYDFQMLVGDNGHGNSESTPYYLFMEVD